MEPTNSIRNPKTREVLQRARRSKIDYIKYEEQECGQSYRDPSLDTYSTEKEDVEHYLGELRRILEGLPNYGTPPEPGMIYDNVFIGTTSNAENLALLRRSNIKTLLNLAGYNLVRADREMRHYKNPESVVELYDEIVIEEGETYDISKHFSRANSFIDRARRNGRVMIFSPDVDRTGAIGINYLLHRGYSLLQAAKLVKDTRKAALYNKGFMKRLIVYARDHGLLTKSVPHLGAVHFEGLSRVRDRPAKSHFLVIR